MQSMKVITFTDVSLIFCLSDSSKYPSSSGGGSNEGIIADLAPPVFTSETKNSPRTYRKSVGESFQVSCHHVKFSLEQWFSTQIAP